MNQGLSRRGKLTIFLGASSGVGKTYAMLEAATEKMSQGDQVYIGWLEDDSSPELDLFIQKLPRIGTGDGDSIEIAGIDVNRIVQEKPQLILIDNLASRYLRGQRHNYRYQDVEELLDRGIDVFTTLNIYQVESLKDIVEQITGIEVKDTVPDRLLEIADIRVVDISQEELLQRLKKGKVSLPQEDGQLSEKFFRPGNIGALRELALRYTAQRVDIQLNEYMKAHNIKGPWPAGERIMACIGPSPFSAHVIRAARRMADGFKAEWCVAYVETQQRSPGNEKGYEQLDNNLRLAEQLGAEVIILNGEDVADELSELARRKNITQIVIGKPLHSKFSELWKGSVVDKIIKESSGKSVHIIPGEMAEKKQKSKREGWPRIRFAPYILTIVLIILTTLINKFSGFDLINIALLYLLPVLFSAAYFGRGPSILASVLGVLSYDVFFVPPVLSITVHDLKYIISFVVFLLVAVITGTMANRLRNQAATAQKREARTAALYSLSRKIVAETDIKGILNTLGNAIAETIDAEVSILLPDASGLLKTRVNAADTLEITDIEAALQPDDEVAGWVFEHGKMAGYGTETWGDKEALYIPLKTEERIIGVLVVRSIDTRRYISKEQNQLLEAFANLTALSVVSLQLSAEAQQARCLIQSEKLRTALFNSISHELRTPLASIIGAVTSLLDEVDLYSKADRQALLQTINDGALRMNRLVGNLLDMARLESGMMQLKYEWCDFPEIIGVALRRTAVVIQERNVKIDIPGDIPLIKADFVLIEQVLINLLDNACKYSRPGTDIIIGAKREGDLIEVRIVNSGSQIPDEEREKVFDKFYRMNSYQHITGTGLGLSICKGIIEAHGGQIWVEAGETTVAFVFSLPVGAAPPAIPPEKAGE